MYQIVYLISAAFMLALPAFLGITAWNLLNPKEQALPFSFAIPHINALTLAIFVVSCLLHELGHFASAKALGADVVGIGFGVRCFVPQFFVKVDDVSMKQRR